MGGPFGGNGRVPKHRVLLPREGPQPWPLDGCFGQMCVKLSLAEFDDDLEVVAILDEFLMSSGLDSGSREGARAYKLDKAL